MLPHSQFLQHINNLNKIGYTTSGIENCLYDYLNICCFNNNLNNNSSENSKTFCGSWLPPSIISENNKLQLLLKTDSSIVGSGYEIYYYSVKISSKFFN
jgi:hypothetical protein